MQIANTQAESKIKSLAAQLNQLRENNAKLKADLQIRDQAKSDTGI